MKKAQDIEDAEVIGEKKLEAGVIVKIAGTILVPITNGTFKVVEVHEDGSLVLDLLRKGESAEIELDHLGYGLRTLPHKF